MSDKNNKFESSSTEEFRAIRMKRQKSHSQHAVGTKKKKKLAGWQKLFVVLWSLIVLAIISIGPMFVYHKYIYKPVSNDDFTPKPDNNTVLVDDTGNPVPPSAAILMMAGSFHPSHRSSPDRLPS